MAFRNFAFSDNDWVENDPTANYSALSQMEDVKHTRRAFQDTFSSHNVTSGMNMRSTQKCCLLTDLKKSKATFGPE